MSGLSSSSSTATEDFEHLHKEALARAQESQAQLQREFEAFKKSRKAMEKDHKAMREEILHQKNEIALQQTAAVTENVMMISKHKANTQLSQKRKPNKKQQVMPRIRLWCSVSYQASLSSFAIVFLHLKQEEVQTSPGDFPAKSSAKKKVRSQNCFCHANNFYAKDHLTTFPVG